MKKWFVLGLRGKNWKPWSYSLQNLHSNRVKCADSLPRGYGTLKRFLIILEYFNAIQGCVIDTMLSLFLGTAKQNILTFML